MKSAGWTGMTVHVPRAWEQSGRTMLPVGPGAPSVRLTRSSTWRAKYRQFLPWSPHRESASSPTPPPPHTTWQVTWPFSWPSPWSRSALTCHCRNAAYQGLTPGRQAYDCLSRADNRALWPCEHFFFWGKEIVKFYDYIIFFCLYY